MDDGRRAYYVLRAACCVFCRSMLDVPSSTLFSSLVVSATTRMGTIIMKIAAGAADRPRATPHRLPSVVHRLPTDFHLSDNYKQ